MIVFDLKCYDQGHIFEGWFASSADYEMQRESGMISCPVCGDSHVRKAVMSPAIGAKSNQHSAMPTHAPPEGERAIALSNGTATAEMEQMQNLIAKLAEVQARLLQKSEWVGRDFADRARAMHYGEEAPKQIHGEVAAHEARELIEEGLEVAPLPLPVVPPEVQN